MVSEFEISCRDERILRVGEHEEREEGDLEMRIALYIGIQNTLTTIH